MLRVPPAVLREVEDARRMASVAVTTAAQKHGVVVDGPTMYSKDIYRFATTHSAVASCAEMVQDNVVNVFMPTLVRTKTRRIAALGSDAYYMPAPVLRGSKAADVGIAATYDLQRHADLHAALYEKDAPDGLLGCEVILVPIYRPGHWCLGVVDHTKQQFEVWDTLGGQHVAGFAEHMTAYLERYARERVKRPAPPYSKFARVVPPETPRQPDGMSCGLFMLAIAALRADDAPVLLRGEDVEVLRMYVIYTIITLRNPWRDVQKMLEVRKKKAVVAKQRMPPPEMIRKRANKPSYLTVIRPPESSRPKRRKKASFDGESYGLVEPPKVWKQTTLAEPAPQERDTWLERMLAESKPPVTSSELFK